MKLSKEEFEKILSNSGEVEYISTANTHSFGAHFASMNRWQKGKVVQEDDYFLLIGKNEDEYYSLSYDTYIGEAYDDDDDIIRGSLFFFKQEIIVQP